MKLILRLAILVFLFSNLAACSNDGAPGSNSGSPQNSKPDNPSRGGGGTGGGTIEPSGCGQISLAPYPKFVSISTLYPNPAELLTTSDPVSALYRLKQIASPTEEYHRELYQLATAARSLDFAHLLLLVRASYFTAPELRHTQAEIAATAGKTDNASCTRRASAWRDVQQSYVTKIYSFMTIDTALSKLNTAMSWDEARELIGEIFHDMDPGTAQVIAERFRPLSEARVLELMRLTDELNLQQTAGEFAFEWFRNHSDRRFETLISTAGEVHFGAKDVLLLKGVESFSRFTLPQLLALIEASSNQSGDIAAKAIARIDQFTHERVLQILPKIGSDDGRGKFLRSAINLYARLTTAELKALLNSTPAYRNEIAVAAAAKVSDINFDNIHSVAGLLSGQAKDQWIQPLIEKLDKVTTSQLITLMEDAYYGGFTFAKALRPKVSDLDLKHLLLVCDKLTGTNRDEWLDLALASISQLKTDDVIRVMDAAYYSGFTQAKALLPKISDFNFESIFTINAKLNGTNHDEWLQLTIGRFPSYTAPQVVRLMEGAYYQGFAIAKTLLPQISALDLAGVLLINQQLNGTNHDEWLELVLPRFKSLRASEVALLMDGAYYKAFEIAKNSLPKLSDFGVPAILLLIEKMNGQNRDSWLELTLPKLGKVSTAQALDLVEAAYYNGSKTAQALLARITDLTVQNAIQLAEKLTGQSKDELLLKAVDLVTDLNRSNLKELASAAYYAEKEVIKKGEKRLGSR